MRESSRSIGSPGMKPRDRPVDRHRDEEGQEVDDELAREVSDHATSSGVRTARSNARHPSRDGAGRGVARSSACAPPLRARGPEAGEHVDARHLPVVPPGGGRELAARADGQFVQYCVLTIDHMPLYQSGIAGRSCRKIVCSLDIDRLVGACVRGRRLVQRLREVPGGLVRVALVVDRRLVRPGSAAGRCTGSTSTACSSTAGRCRAAGRSSRDRGRRRASRTRGTPA